MKVNHFLGVDMTNAYMSSGAALTDAEKAMKVIYWVGDYTDLFKQDRYIDCIKMIFHELAASTHFDDKNITKATWFFKDGSVIEEIYDEDVLDGYRLRLSLTEEEFQSHKTSKLKEEK